MVNWPHLMFRYLNGDRLSISFLTSPLSCGCGRVSLTTLGLLRQVLG